MKKLLTTVLLLIISSPTIAGFTESQITNLTTNSQGDVVFGLTTQPSGTCNNQGWHLKLETNSAGIDKMYSMLLAAKMAQTPVRIWFTDSTAAGTNYPTCNTSAMAEATTIALE